ncbi:HemK family methyltransferase [Pleurostoma richardsiae]|uniref:HemK family methyltransferase n=1 Tax=Pleurostoma richardsiae TaxID=41990 RepID=A0AA38VGC1_9PEZI|nr:HemK family methyltransferase [Pleurostoma richardsiae]
MPRLPPSLLRTAYSISPNAAALLPACRDLPSAVNELRWIREHVGASASASPAARPEREVARLCRLRGRGVPLQYVLGSQPFGPLDIKCRPGVLIPRPEPEAYTTHLASLVRGGILGRRASHQPGLSIVDFCTGTGCIALLLYALLAPSFPGLHVRGIDISPQAVALARENAIRNVRMGYMLPPNRGDSQRPQDQGGARALQFDQGDLFSDDLVASLQARRWDIITCNPPYISHAGFARGTARSVRNYEPKLAQVPGPRAGYATRCAPEDVFYARLLDVGAALRPGLVLVEVGDMAQALRVAGMAARQAASSEQGPAVEIWRDWPDAVPEEVEETAAKVDGVEIPIRGSGHGRSVLIRYGKWDT